MKSIYHSADRRGHVSLGWLDSHHSFSFGHYYDPEKTEFGALRVLNDDIVNGGGGFGKHPHDNMEIVSIPLQGDLEHQDSTGTQAVIKQGDVQIMSAGSGIQHSEKNHSAGDAVNFLQIWIQPKVRNIKPRYDQKTFKVEDRNDKWQTVVAPDIDSAVWINQDAWFSMSNLGVGKKIQYDLKKKGNGVYLFLIDGRINVENDVLVKRDAIGISETEKINITADSASEILIIEVPMI